MGIILHILDASSILPTLQPSKADKELALSVTSSGRNVLFVALGTSAGVMISSVVPLISGTVGDPKSQGYGPMAFVAFAAMHFVGKAAALASMPESSLTAPAPLVGAITSLCGCTVATGCGLIAARLADRPGALRPLLLGAGLFTAHAASGISFAHQCHSRGK